MSHSDETRLLKQENELLHQEVHKLTLKLEGVLKSHSTEIEYLKDEHEHEKKALNAQIAKIHEEYKAREALKDEKNQALTEELNSMKEELDGVLQQNEKYRTQIEILKNAKSAGVASSYSDYEGLKESQRILRLQLAEKDEILTAQTEKFSRLDREVEALRGMVTELTEIGEGKDSAIKELQARIKEIEREKEEETGALQNEVLILKEEVKKLSGALKSDDGKGGTASGASRGNSLFSEVEERRLKVESEMQRLRDIVKKLTAENRALQLDLERGDSHSASITTQFEVIAKSEEALAMDIKKDKSETLQLFDAYRERLEYLRSEYRRKLEQYKAGSSLTTPSELETLRQDRDSLQLLKIAMERENNELKRELKYNKHLRTHAEANVKILKAKLDYAKSDASKADNKNAENNEVNDLNCNPIDNGTIEHQANVTEHAAPKRSLITKHENPEQCNQM